MAEFNPDVGGVPSPNMPDQTGASRGSTPNRAWGTLFEGLGEAVTGTATVIDTQIKSNIRTDANDIFTTANKPYDVAPADLTKGTEGIKTLQAAWEQGKISDVHYYGMLNTELKKLRSKYPGYEEVVDATIQDVTGVRPANSYRNAIISEMNSQANEASDKEKQWSNWENSNQSTIAFMYPDYFTNPDKYSNRRGEVRADVARYDAVKENDKYMKDTNADAIYASATASLSLDVNTMIGNLPKVLGLEEDNVYQFLAKAAKVAPTAEESLALGANLSQMILRAEASIDAQMVATRETANSQPGDAPASWFSVLGATRAKEIKEQVLAPLKNLQQYIGNGDFTLAAYQTQLIEAQKNDDVASLLNGTEGAFFRAKMAADKVDPELFNSWIAQNTSAKDNAYTKAIPELLARITTKDGVSTNDIAGEIAKNTKASETDRALALKQLINGVSVTLEQPNYTTPDEVNRVVENTYSKADGEDIFDLVSDEDFMSVYNRMFSPKITDTIKAQGSPDSLKTYQDAALDRFQRVPQFRDVAATLPDIQAAGYTVIVDEQGVITAYKTKPGTATGNDAINRRVDAKQTQDINKTLSTLNNSFRLMDDIMLPDGASKEQRNALHTELLKMLGSEITNNKQGNFFDWVAGQFPSLFSEASDTQDKKGTAQVADAGANIAFDLPDSVISGDAAGLDTYFSNIRSAESGGNDRAKNPNSSAEGRYQVTDATWNRYASRLGLTDKTDPAQQERFIKVFTKDNEDLLIKNGVPITNASRYAAHFLGAGDAVEIYSDASDTDLVSDWVPPRVITANKFLKGMTVAEFKQWAQRKAG